MLFNHNLRGGGGGGIYSGGMRDLDTPLEDAFDNAHLLCLQCYLPIITVERVKRERTILMMPTCSICSASTENCSWKSKRRTDDF